MSWGRGGGGFEKGYKRFVFINSYNFEYFIGLEDIQGEYQVITYESFKKELQHVEAIYNMN